jgi:hypothetical protein
LVLAQLVALVAAAAVFAASPGAYFEDVKTYRAHSDDFKYGYAAGLYDAVSMFAAIAQGPGLENPLVIKLFQCLDQRSAQLDQLTGWMGQLAQNTADSSASMISVIAQACGTSVAQTVSFFDHVSTYKGDTQDYQRGYAAGFYDADSQWADAAARSVISINNARTVSTWRCLDGKGSKLGQLRDWVDTTLKNAPDTDVVRSDVLAACQGTIANLLAPTGSRGNGFPTASAWKTYWYIPIGVAAAALGLYRLARRKHVVIPGMAIPPSPPADAQGPPAPGPAEVVPPSPAAPSTPDGARAGISDRREWEAATPLPQAPTGLWLWVPGRLPLSLALGSRVSARELGSSPTAAGADDVAAVVEQDSGAPQRFRLRNRSERTWWVREPGADWNEAPPGTAVPLVPGTTMMVGEVRVSLQPWEVQPLRPAWQPQLRIGERLVTVAGDLQLYEYDLAGLTATATDGIVARVSVKSTDDIVLGLQNLSTVTWVATPPDSGPKEIEPGRTIRLRPGMRIVCGVATIEVE